MDLLINKKCTCKYSTGSTHIECCNICGLPLEKEKWHFFLPEDLVSRVELPVKPAKAINWKEERWRTDGYINNIKLFSIAYEGLTWRDKNPYNLTSRLPQLKAVEVESIDEGKNKAQELLNKYIKLLSV